MSPPDGLSPQREAQEAQFRAADPASNVFVMASAGSGKTKLLTDRMQRLLISGVDPRRILCLTYTRAAAAEMATRLADVLGHWAVAPEEELTRRLSALLARAPTREECARARRLFAQVLDLPGGLRISTLHAFAQSLLRGFPLEAGLMPGFALFEGMDEEATLAEVREEVLPTHPEMSLLASFAGEADLALLTREFVDHEQRLLEAERRHGGEEGVLAALRRALGVPEETGDEALREEEATPGDEDALSRAAALLRTSGNANDAARGDAMRDWLALGDVQRLGAIEDWRAIFLTKEGTPKAPKNLATKGGLGARVGEVHDIMLAEAARLAAIGQRRTALALFEATAAALRTGHDLLAQYNQVKHGAGRQSYDDLIRGARKLLADPGAAWVLYKLDGGLDHVLVDEAQDSNPAQWDIVAAITDEFFAGEGRSDAPRTVFAVGDVKQSIFSFQGADAAGLPRARAHFGQAADDAGQRFREERLGVSFRSAPAVLDLVDQVFAEGPAREGVLPPGEELHHRPNREGAAGRVELWPLLAAEDGEAPPEWAVPEQPVAEAGPEARLATALARRIRHMLDHERLDARHEGDPAIPRRIRPGDILVLLRKRDAFAALLIRELKRLQVPVGGLDRVKLIEHIAVRDVLATLDAVLLPQDDLQLASALKSPVFGLDDGHLFDLAHGRTGRLFDRLMAHRGAETPEGRAADLLAALIQRADHVPPHALIAELLGERGGRRRLLERLGPEAQDPLDELLNAALTHEGAHAPSLQGFLHWLRRTNAEVKREPEGAGGAVRVMTVHGAKGLQAPVVVLPHTVSSPPRESGLRWTEDGLPLWAPRKTGFATPELDAADRERAERQRQEDHRLLYVALTRAEDRLLVCGFYRKKAPEEHWHGLIEAGLRRLGAREEPFRPEFFGADADGFLPGPMLLHDNPQSGPRQDDRLRERPDAPEEPPGWAFRPLGEADVRRVVLTPSRDADAEAPAAAPHAPSDPLGRRFRRGQLIHCLLQHLPELPPEERAAAARRFLERPVHGLDEAGRAEVLAETFAVMDMPELAPAFGPGSLAEAPIAARLGDDTIIGVVDRLVVRAEEVLLVDYKTNRPPPLAPEDTPPAYLRQMALYRHALRLAFPGRAVRAALIWTYDARAMTLPDALLDRHLPQGLPQEGIGHA
ncbi:MAG: double-strand break repair helicase AddA [Acetobacteraceae bacterium]|nr:double-strand break repair helicase AddA [Acetobacteraceae bacterium]